MSRVKIKNRTETPKPIRELGGRSRTRGIKNSYDAAQTTPSNARHWIAADANSATAANSEAVRSTLRRRSRYEIANNPYASGAVELIVDDLIGTGPRPHVRSMDGFEDTDEKVEAEFEYFLESIDITEKLRTLIKGELGSGEAFALFTRSRPRAGRETGRRGLFDPRPQVELGLHIIEADQVQTPDLIEGVGGEVSGIEQDQYGNPVAYHVLEDHPGDTGIGASFNPKYKRVPADLVGHYYEPKRPGDARGIPPFTPALEMFAYLRRLTLATLDSSENIANVAGMLKTDGPADGDSAELDTLDTIDFERGQIMVLPDGWDYVQAKAEQPTDSYPEYVRQILRAIARTLNLPYSIFAGDSTELNYSSGRLDHQSYRKGVKNKQAKIVRIILNRLFWHWFDEASRLSDLLPQEARTQRYRDAIKLRFFFDGSGHVDPVKEANGAKIRVEEGFSSLPIEAAESGYKWQDILKDRMRVQEFAEQIGLNMGPKPSPETAGTTGKDEDDDE